MFAKRLFLRLLFGALPLQTAPGQQDLSSPMTERPQATLPAVALPPAGPQITFNSVHLEGPYIALTFDDGPHPTLTPKLLDLLAAHRMKATFFVVGQNVVQYPEIVKRAAREGHEIANHSWSHPNLGKMPDEAVRRELQKTDDAIRAVIGVRPTLMRPPYASITPRQKRWFYGEFGYRIIIWDVDPLDWKRPGPNVVSNRIVTQTRPGSIVLAHDIHPPTLEAMSATLDQLQAKGFKCVTVSELLSMARPSPPRPIASPQPIVFPPANPPIALPPHPAKAPPGGVAPDN